MKKIKNTLTHSHIKYKQANKQINKKNYPNKKNVYSFATKVRLRKSHLLCIEKKFKHEQTNKIQQTNQCYPKQN